MTRTLADAHEHCGVIGQTWRAPQSLVMSAGHSMTWNAAEQLYNTTYRTL
ncbi:MAG: hypothetical protein ACXVAW_18795 [Vulcanimicrobiaceae bacterium]